MPKRIPPLTEARIDQATPREKPYRLFDGAGLYIEVQPSGSKIWRMKYRQPDRSENALTFGRYPEVSIAKAREHQCTARKMLKQVLDPRTAFNHAKLHPRPELIPLDELFNEADWGHLQASILQTARYAIYHLEATLFPALTRIPSDEARRNILRASTQQIEQTALQALYRQLEGVATAITGSYLRSGMSTDDLAIAMQERRERARRAVDVAGSKSQHGYSRPG